MYDNIEQLLKNLKLSRIADVLERELQRATKTSCTYEELLARLLRHEYQCRQEQALEARIKRARLPERFCWLNATLDSGHGLAPTEVVLCTPTAHRAQVALTSGVPSLTTVMSYWEWSGSMEPPSEGHLLLPEDPGAGELVLS